MTAIQRKRANLERRLATVQDEWATLKACCPHEAVKRTEKSDTGNWCAADDRYWVACECLDCGKLWTEWK